MAACLAQFKTPRNLNTETLIANGYVLEICYRLKMFLKETWHLQFESEHRPVNFVNLFT
jgi:hypothetical protein